MDKLKLKLFEIMSVTDYMDQDIEADVEEFVELEFDGMYEKELKGNNKKIRSIWFEFCYDEHKDEYLKKFNLV